MAARPHLSNGPLVLLQSIWDLITEKDTERANTETTLLASATRTGYTEAPIQTNPYAKGVVLHLNVTAAAQNSSLRLQLRYRDPASGSILRVVWESSGITEEGVHRFIFHPGVTDVERPGVAVVALPIPRQWTAALARSGTEEEWTYSLGCSYIL